MHRVKSLPDYLLKRYNNWKDTSFPESRDLIRKLAVEGQHPKAMVIACCDSRVDVTSIFGQKTGELFVHRNIANLVPPYAPGVHNHGTGAALEYAVNHLKVSHIVIIGHSRCGGVAGCIAMCSDEAPEFEKETSLIGRWLDILRPGFSRVADIADPDAKQMALEKEGVHVSLENLLTYPFVKSAVDDGSLSLHGLWTDIEDMGIEAFDGTIRHFAPA